MSLKPGRNDPCPCGSGQKYKRCCLEKDQQAERAALAQAAAERLATTSHPHHDDHDDDHDDEHCDFCGDALVDDDGDELTRASNAIVDMVQDGRLDEAEQAARDFLVRFPEVHDGYDRLGMVYEARGELKKAADCYRKVIDFVRTHPEQYEPDFERLFEDLVAELDPPPSP